MNVVVQNPFDLTDYLVRGTKSIAKALVRALETDGFVIVHDPRVSQAKNTDYINMMRRYFSQSKEVLLRDERPDLDYQSGIMRPGVEVPAMDFLQLLPFMRHEDWPELPERLENGEIAGDIKWRFFIPFSSDRHGDTLCKNPVLPEGFPEWEQVSADWGVSMLRSIWTIAELAAIGLECEPDTFTKFLEGADHLLSPNANDLREEPDIGTIFNGIHTDLNFATAHGKSNIGGMVHLWRNNRGSLQKCTVNVPDGCLLIQVGEQWEWLTGGLFSAGYHEVVYTEQAHSIRQELMDRYPNDPTQLIRISSTVFATCQNDQTLKPIDAVIQQCLTELDQKRAGLLFPPTRVLDQVIAKLKKIKMKRD